MKDEVYRQKRPSVEAFEFNDTVAEVFDDMISRSVPGYGLMLSMMELLTRRFAIPGTDLYDLGCSLGAGTLRLAEHAPASCTIHAVDNSPAMIGRLRNALRQRELVGQRSHSDGRGTAAARVVLHEADIRDIAVQHASLVALNLTLQFLPVGERLGVLQAIHEGLLPGGALFLSEKIDFKNAGQQRLLSEVHHDFKRAQGYSDLEIAQKRSALENTLMTESLEEHCQRLTAVGFELVTPWFQCFNFASLLAVKHTAIQGVASPTDERSPQDAS